MPRSWLATAVALAVGGTLALPLGVASAAALGVDGGVLEHWVLAGPEVGPKPSPGRVTRSGARPATPTRAPASAPTSPPPSTPAPAPGVVGSSARPTPGTTAGPVAPSPGTSTTGPASGS